MLWIVVVVLVLAMLTPLGADLLLKATGVLLGATTLLWLVQFVRARAAWSEAAEALGVEPEAPGPYRLAGRVDGFAVTVESTLGRLLSFTSIRKTSVIVYLGELVPSTLTLLPISVIQSLLPEQTMVQGPIGDPRIDRNLTLAGSRTDLLARLDADTRRFIYDNWLTSFSVSLVVRERCLRWDKPRLIRSAADLERRARLAVELAKHLTRATGRMPEALRDNALADPSEAVREQNVRALLSTFPRTPEARKVAREVLDAEDPEVRLMAIRSLGEPAAEVYRELLMRRDLDPPVRAAAVAELAKWPDRAWALERLDELLAGPSSPARRDALRLVAELRHEGAAPRLLELVGRVEGGEAEALAAALARVGDESDERTAIGLLAHQSLELRRRAVLGLAKLGTSRAVGPLRALGQRAQPTLRQAIQGAINAIEGRHGVVRGGRLTLATIEGDAGGLSLADDAGGLAVVEPGDEGEASDEAATSGASVQAKD